MRFMGYFQNGKPQLIPLNSVAFLACFAETEAARLLLEQALIARKKLAEVDPESQDGIYYRGKLASAKFFCRNTLPRVFARHMTIEQEDLSAVEIPEEAF